ncbi:MAG: outer membrane lipoprotein carrier protein LolA [Crocinitomicaceae bacterium]|nr:outer membrane lipoprotein carrier protein LolA [Crocinitomicaceae bacterium]MDG1776350.1 outer membrane lipoprotein carrier protein LolA [Crocinitomicaceae bacterium]
MKLLITLLTFASLSLTSFGQDAKSQDILDALSTKMKTQHSFYIEFNASIKNSSTGTNESETGKGWVKSNKYHASFGDNTIISNGLKTWTIVKEEKSVYESDADEDDEESINPSKLMTIWETGFKNKYHKEITLNNDPTHVIYLYPKNPGSVEYHTIILYISKEKNELKKVTMKTKDGTSVTYSLTKFTSNTTIADSKFVFDSKKYPGYNVIRD